jgi:hypothetical protein
MRKPVVWRLNTTAIVQARRLRPAALARALTDRDLSDQLLARGVETAMKLLECANRRLRPSALSPGLDDE